jgi:hypothetical protein
LRAGVLLVALIGIDLQDEIAEIITMDLVARPLKPCSFAGLSKPQSTDGLVIGSSLATMWSLLSAPC